MEIKNIEEEPIKEYPTRDEVSNTKLKKSIPKKWKVYGISTLAILLIVFGSIGFIIFRSATTQLAGSVIYPMPFQEKDQFNQRFLGYEGNYVSGSTVKSLISTVISNNMQMVYDDTPYKMVSIAVINETYKDILQSSDKLNQLRQSIVSGEKYKVQASINETTGLVDEISIKGRLNTQEKQSKTQNQNTNNDNNTVQINPTNKPFSGTTINHENYKAYIKNISTSDDYDKIRTGVLVFDGKIGSETGCWHSTYNNEHWIQFDMIEPCMLKEFTIQNRTKEIKDGITCKYSYAIEDFEMQASSDGTNWINIGNFKNISDEFGKSQHFIVDYNYDKSYSYYRIHISSLSVIAIGEMELSIIK